MSYSKMQMGGQQDAILSFLTQYAQSKGINPEELIADFQQATPEQQQEFLAQLTPQQAMKFGGIPRSENGVFDYPNQPVIVPTRGSGNISMRNVPFGIQAYDNKTMEYLGYMNPEQEYDFDADEILEVPVVQYGSKIFDSKSGTYTDPNTGKQYTLVNGQYVEIGEGLKGLSSTGNLFLNKAQVLPKGTSISKKELKEEVKKEQKKGNFITGLKGFTTGEQMTPVYKDSWVEEWSAIDPDFKKKSFAQQQAFAQEWTKKNAPDYYKGIGNTFKGYDIDKMTSDKKFGSITNQLRPSLAKGKTGSFDFDLPETDPTNPEAGIGKIPIDPKKSPFPVLEDTTYLLDRQEAARKAKADEMLEIGTLTDKDYFSPYLSNAKRRANRVMSPYFKDVDLSTPQPLFVDVSPRLANINRQVRSALQNTNPNSTVGQALKAQLFSNASFQSNLAQAQVDTENKQIGNAWQNQVLGIQNQKAMLDDANRAQYVDDWARTLTNKDNIENLIDMQASTFKMQRQKEANELALLDATLNNIDFRRNSDGSNTIMQKKTSDFKNPWESLSDAQVMSQFMKKDTKTAKFGLKKKAPY